MTQTRRDSNFLNAPVVVPGKADSLINNFASSLDANILNIFKQLVKDLEDYKISMAGITRRFDQMLFIYNNPSQKQTDIQEALRMDKYGNFAIGTEYPRWPLCKVDVNGALYAIPQFGLWSKTTTTAGVGLYDWDTEVYNPNTDIYKRVTNGGVANGGIQITEPGTYDVRVNAYVQDVAAATGDDIVWQIRQNGTIIVGFRNSLFADDLSMQTASKIINVVRNDVIDLNLAAPATSARFGNASTFNTWLEICKVN